MRRIILFFAFATATAFAQDTITRDTVRILPSPKEKEALAAATRVEKPNRIVTPRRTVSGIAVQVIKTDNPLQLINPFAPAKYGSGFDNLVAEPDPVTGRPSGLAVLRVSVGH